MDHRQNALSGWLLWIVAAWLTFSGGLSYAAEAEYLRLGISGDGVTPSASDLRAGLEQAVKSSAFASSTSDTGDASYSIAIDLPAAVLVPGVSLQYNSGGAFGVLGRGWTLGLDLAVEKSSGPGNGGYPKDTYLVNGTINGAFTVVDYEPPVCGSRSPCPTEMRVVSSHS